MAERPEDLNLPNAVVTRIIKDAVRPSKDLTVLSSRVLRSGSVNIIIKKNTE
jgi:hypothetical protein